MMLLFTNIAKIEDAQPGDLTFLYLLLMKNSSLVTKSLGCTG